MGNVVLVDESDVSVGIAEKQQAHIKGLLHRAFSVFIFNEAGELLLQKRAKNKYHSGGLWTNTCCSHPDLGEDVKVVAERRLQSEMGINCELTFLFTELYELPLENGLVEHELDHVFYGNSNELPVLDPEEAMDFKYASFEELSREVLLDPSGFTEWFKILWEKVFESVKAKKQD